MSNVSVKAEHLIRAALKGIERNPDSWLQDHWVCTPEDARYFKDSGVSGSLPECGTSYCLGGWVMLYDGWRHESRREGTFRHAWIKGDMEITDPYWEFLKDLVYGEGSETYLFDSIFSADIDMPEILARVDDQLEINFEEDCPCLTEPDSCNLQGCPCGMHTSALEAAPSTPTAVDTSMMKVIEKMVRQCAEAGAPIHIRQVLDDPILMAAFRGMFLAGETSLVTTVTAKAERRISEIRTRLEGEARDRVAQESGLQQKQIPSPTLGAQITRQATTIRKLQGRVDALRAGTLESTEFRKLKAKCERLELSNRALTLNNKDLANRFDTLKDELAEQKRVVGQVRFRAREEGQQKAIAAWQKALDIVKKEGGLHG